MTQQHFSQKYINPIEKPLQEMIELNMRTLQKFSYLHPADLFNPQKPEEVLEKNMHVFIQNSHKTLDYMQDMFHLMEKNWHNISDKLALNTKELMSQAQTVTQHGLKEAVSEGQRTAKKVASSMKKSVKKTESAAQKSLKDTAKTMKKATKTASSVLKGAAKPSASKTKPKTTKKAAATPTKKPEVRRMSTSAAQKPNTMNKMESKIHETRQVSQLTVPTVSNDSDTNNKDRPLM
ncbi:hypothetical protein TUM19329_08280 [Legionella antarctica]|uniref:Phasin domain-containing protein n=1 Tax=Legionella antarctica TaxID=2708020 RepID=A0A6F8T2R6_9GAMM|nr:hypothetical protein [Legionella antarctica]BCA94467.1 hypothetical protein TUM19329_08280 [Legionella antarctica]